MLFRKHIVSTRTLLQLTMATVFCVGGVGAALAAGVTNMGTSTTPPLLVPYTIYTIAGTPQYPTGLTSVVAGFGGEGLPATTQSAPMYTLPSKITPFGSAAFLDSPYGQAIDSVGNVYISDTSNNIIREVNYQTGNITTIAGVYPKNCSGSTCTVRTSGCADGVPAAGNPIGTGAQGIAVDAYGNVYFDDSTSSTVSVIYRGGTQVANFISLVNPGGVANSGGKVLPGYIYHVAGTINLSACTGVTGTVDNVPAFENIAAAGATTGGQLHGPGFLTLDSAGNIYVADVSNSTVRVINTQATPQTFFQYTVQPGYIHAITNCNSMTLACPTATTTASANTGINGPANGVVYNSQYRGGEVDAYGNVYQVNQSGGSIGPPGGYSAAAYAGGPPLTNLLTVEAPLLASSYGPNATPPNAPAEIPLTYGNGYIDIGNPVLTSTLPNSFPDVLAVTNEDLNIRSSSMLPDVFGTFWYNDNHYPELSRIDQYTGLSVDIIGSNSERATASVAGLGISNYNQPANFNNPWYCVYGASGNAWTQGPQTFDPQGDGCPAILAAYSGGVHPTESDGLGNIYLNDGGANLIRELPLGNLFPMTAVGTATPVTQAIQVHFNSANPPQIGPSVPDAQMAANTTTAFTIAGAPMCNTPSTADFCINQLTPEFPMGSLVSSGHGYSFNATTANFGLWPAPATPPAVQAPGLPTCTQLGAAPIATIVTDYDCLVYVTFTPQGPGARKGQLTATTANGGVFNFPLYGIGTGPQLAVDGGAPAVAGVTGLGTTAGIAVSATGVMYIADPTHNQVVSCTLPLIGSNNTCTAQGTIGTGLKGPMGVATDIAGNVYISDTGNNRVLKVVPATPTQAAIQTVLGNYVWIPGAICDSGSTTSPCPSVGLSKEPGASVSPTTAPPQYAFKGPQGLAVDVWNNVYVADTGNSAVVEIPSNPQLGGAVPLLSYSGAPQFKNPVAIAVDAKGNVYVADTKNPSGQVVELPPGGGDLVTVPGTQFTNLVPFPAKSPNGVAVDAAGNVYVSDSVSNVVEEVPSGPATAYFALNFPGVSAPAGLALDSLGNLYVADSGNKQVLFDNRLNPTIQFGLVPQDQTTPQVQPICAGTAFNDGYNTGNNSPCLVTVTNIGNTAVTFGAPLLTTPSNTAYSITAGTCTSATLNPGTTCTLATTFDPTSDSGTASSVTLSAAAGSGVSVPVTLLAQGEQPQVNIALASSLGLAPAAGTTTIVTATVTQAHIPPGAPPTGSVTFTVVVDKANNNVNSCGTNETVTSPLVGGVATLSLGPLAQGVTYDVTANYTGDSFNSATQSADLPIKVPGISVTATVSSTAAQLTFTYGSTAPVPAGTVTPTPPSPITYSFGSAATSCSTIGTYPVVVSFSGAGACAYGFPPSVFSGGGAAVVQENPAPLTYTIPNFTSFFGAQNITFSAPPAGATGGQCGDGFGATFVINPGGGTQSSLEQVGTYTVVPTVIGADAGDYTVTAKSSTLTVTKATAVIGASLSPTSVANTAAAVATVSLAVSVASGVGGGIGTPTGTVVVTDTFTPITTTGLGAPSTTTTTLPLTLGAATYPPTGTLLATTPGMHQYSFAYSGDANFATATLVPSPTAAACTPAALAANCLLVDYPDFFLTSNTGPVAINPGTVPSGNGLLPAPNQSTAYPETAVIFINQILGFVGSVNVTCSPQSPAYTTCFMTPPSVCFAASSSAACTNTSKSAATVVAVQTPATLPLGFKTSELRTAATRTVLAFLPFGVLAFCVRRRRRLSKALWVLMMVSAIGAGMTGCGGNQVNFYTPVPTGPQTVTVTASGIGNSGQTTNLTRSFVVPLNID
jgi:sugar lactone lactonase YvrE